MEQAPNGKRAWIEAIWPIVTAALIAAAAVGTSASVIYVQGREIGNLQDDIKRLDAADKIAQEKISISIAERDHLLEMLERRITDKSDTFNQKIASATATNEATRDMLMMIEHRLEMLEAEGRKK